MARRTDGRPRHQQIAAELRARIMAGDLPAGAQLPSTQQLVAQFDASNATVQRALMLLKDEGFLNSHVGKGVYVRRKQPLVVEAVPYFPVLPSGYSYDLLEVVKVCPPMEIREALGLITADASAVLRRRVMTHAGDPVELSWSYYPSSIADGTDLARNRKIRGGAPRVLDDLSYPQRSVVDRISVRMPTPEEIEALDLPGDVPILRQLRIIYSDRDMPVEASVLVKGGHMYELLYRQQAM